MADPDDQPYRPRFSDPSDNAEVLASTRPGRSAQPRERSARAWTPPQGRGARSLLPPVDAALRDRLREATGRLDRGEALGEVDLNFLVQRCLLRLVPSRRPTVARAACEALRDMLTAPGMESGAQLAQRDAEEEPELHLPD